MQGAFSVGTPDVVVHMSEEIPYASRNIPRAIGTQVLVGFVTAFIYLVALFYSVSDLDAVINTTYSFPLAEVYLQATNTRGGALGLLIVLFIPIFCTNIGAYITAGMNAPNVSICIKLTDMQVACFGRLPETTQLLYQHKLEGSVPNSTTHSTQRSPVPVLLRY